MKLILEDVVVNVLADETEEIGQLEIIPVFGGVHLDQSVPYPALRGLVKRPRLSFELQFSISPRFASSEAIYMKSVNPVQVYL